MWPACFLLQRIRETSSGTKIIYWAARAVNLLIITKQKATHPSFANARGGAIWLLQLSGPLIRFCSYFKIQIYIRKKVMFFTSPPVERKY